MKDILFDYLSRFTSLSREEQQDIVNNILIEEFKKGTDLLKQGDVPTKCYFVLKGCVRQYSIDEKGNEIISSY
jgi:CRP-like cAMP-binding protein